MKVAILGAWHVHAPDYTRHALELGQVVGVFDEDRAHSEKLAKDFNIPVFDSPEALLSSEAEGVICCAASNRHGDLLVKAAEAGKHIFTEKVLALSVEECLRIKEAVDRAGVRFVISFPQKSAASSRTVLNLAKSGKLGRINTVRFRNVHSGSIAHWLPAHFYDPAATGGGAMVDLGAHGMYLIGELLGEPVSYASAFTHFCRDAQDGILNPAGLEDNAVTVMTFPSGAIGINETGFVSACCPMMLEVDGTEGFARSENGKVFARYPGTDNKLAEIQREEGTEWPIDCFLKGLPAPGCGMEDAILLTKMMVGAYRKQD